MSQQGYLDNVNADYLEQLYTQYKAEPSSVEEGWRTFFEGYDLGRQNKADGTGVVSDKEVAVVKLINAYRARGHLLADTNPVRERRKHKADLALDFFNLSEADLETEYEAGSEIGIGKNTLNSILTHLQKTYCRSLGVEYMHCPDERLREWLEREMEPIANRPQYSLDEKQHILEKIDQAVSFEGFLQKKYVGKKRFSLEGIEAFVPSLEAVIRQGASLGAQEFVIGMAHRGRLNLLVNIFGKTYEDVFSEFEGTPLPSDIKGSGDVKYHLGRSADIVTKDGHKVHLSLVPNPSHLEAVNPVVQGITHAKGLEIYEGDTSKIIPILVHGDAAISGQGVNYEMVNMSQLDGFSTGGTIHVVLNNQVGFTADYKEGRSSMYCTDIAMVTASPVFHVNADDPEAVEHACQLALRVRQEFKIDVYVDILGYRRYGHNEGDEPRFTQPVLYDEIKTHPTIRDFYIEQLVNEGSISREEATKQTQKLKEKLQEKLDYVKDEKPALSIDFLGGHWKKFRPAKPSDYLKSIETGVSKKQLDKVAKALVTTPDDFNLFSKMAKLLGQRQAAYKEGVVDWAMAELLAYGTLLCEGYPVRLVGQDSQRGTFSHRHSVIKDTATEAHYVPLNHIQKRQERIHVFNSFLSEYCVLGFEFGYSMARPTTFVIWEAQFGDFSNGAQIMIDQFIASSESKWQRMSGLTLLLPHGYEGAGPEHSSARLERFLQLSAEGNMYVVNVTTPANYFHLLRRQMKNPFRIPLIVFTPKSLLRHPLVKSPCSELVSGGFQEVIDDPVAKPSKVKRG